MIFLGVVFILLWMGVMPVTVDVCKDKPCSPTPTVLQGGREG